MSMSQEEIEALMSGLEIEDDKEEPSKAEESVKVNTQEIEELLSQTEDYKKEDEKVDDTAKSEDIVEENLDSSVVDDDEIEELISQNNLEEIGDTSEKKPENFVKTDEIEQLLNEIDSNEMSDEKHDIEQSFDEISAESLDNPENDLSIIKDEQKEKSYENSRSEDDIAKDWTSSRINEGIFPFPAEKDTKVVNQLSQVANDSEEKVSQIFDVLSLGLDNNNEIRNNIKNIEVFISNQSRLLESLNKKFPNINVFNEHLNSANSMAGSLDGLKSLMNEEDNQIFQAMELMQFNDINRQKIERVMSVIRKLSLYLNNLFEDDGTSVDVAVAKHIHGDDSNDLIGDDLDKLIEEFSTNK